MNCTIDCVHTTSYPSATPPATQYRAMASLALDVRGCNAAAPGARARSSFARPSQAPSAANRFSTAATHAAPETPSSGSRTNAANRVPQIAPAVLAAYSQPPASPICPSVGVSARTSTGKVPPIKKAGSPTKVKGNNQASRPALASRRANVAALCARARVAPTPSTATANSRPA
ncbi:hypothetical protein D3C78_748060 [compost metagenome]